MIKYQKKFCIYTFLIHISHSSLLPIIKNHFYTLLVIKYQKKCHIYTFLIHISCLLLLSNNKKKFIFCHFTPSILIISYQKIFFIPYYLKQIKKILVCKHLNFTEKKFLNGKKYYLRLSV